MLNIMKQKAARVVAVALVLLALVGSGVYFVADSLQVLPSLTSLTSLSNVLTVGTAEAAGVADATADGTNDNVELQTLLTALPDGGGRISVLTGTFAWANLANVTRAINSVTIDGTGYGTYIDSDGVTAPITAGGNNWVISNMRFDAPGPNMGATTGWVWVNVWVGATHYDYLNPTNSVIAGTLTVDSIDAPVGRSATYVVAASNAATIEIAQADYICDGVADDVQIQAALTALPAGGGEVFLSSGTFAISATLLMPSFSTLSGTGDSTILELDNDINASVINNDTTTFGTRDAAGNSYITVKDFKIDGNKAGQDAEGAPAFSDRSCVEFSTVENLRIENLTIINGWTAGIRTEFVTNVIITGNRIDGSGDDAIAINEETFYATVSNNVMSDSGDAGQFYGSSSGIEIQDGSYRVSVTGNVITATRGTSIPIHTHALKNPPHEVVLTGNTVYSSANLSGISILGDVGTGNIVDVVISSNILYGDITSAVGYGVKFDGYLDRVTVDSNIIHGYSSGIGGAAAGYGNSILITSNNIYDPAGNGIDLGASGSGHNAVIVGNRIEAPGTYGIAVNQVAQIIISNHIRNPGSFGIRLNSASQLAQVYDNTGNISNVGTSNNNIIRNNKDYIAPGELRTISKPITAGVQNTVTSIQNLFAGDVLITEAYVALTTAASATNPTYDMGTDDDGAGAPSVGNNLFEAIPDTVAYYRSLSNGLGGDASGLQVAPILWQTVGNDYVNFIITDAAGADTAGVLYLTVIGK